MASMPDAEVGAVAHENAAFRTGVEQHRVLCIAGLGDQPQSVTEICAQQRLAGDRLGAGAHHIGEFGNGKQRLADVGVAHVVGDDVHAQRIELFEGVADLGHCNCLR
jgi:hypothetical protein